MADTNNAQEPKVIRADVLPVLDITSVPQDNSEIRALDGTIVASSDILTLGSGPMRRPMADLLNVIASVVTPKIDDRTGNWVLLGRDTGIRALAQWPKLAYGEDDTGEGYLYAETVDTLGNVTDRDVVFSFATLRDHIYRAEVINAVIDPKTNRLISYNVAEPNKGQTLILTDRGTNKYVLANLDELRVKFSKLTEEEKAELLKPVSDVIAG
ncbi:MAG: hypothetical protein K2L39_02390, partial [Muribaculaceae bacterium]|nr:hypothetical protein [Muribaculaceae bacterium]